MAKINHLAIIVDGNGRWAEERNLSRSEGHKAGAKNLEKLILNVAHENIANYLSLYVFSTENFKRPVEEVNYLMDLFLKFFDKGKTKYDKENIKVLFSGRRSYLDEKIVSAMKEIEEHTKDNTGLVVNFCLSYGGRAEIADATKGICQKVINGNLNIEEIDEDMFNGYLYNELPNVDFLIRTSGEHRVSNFMLWQISYAEFYFPTDYFPDFDETKLKEAISVYENRDRRFGNVKTKK